MPCGQGTEQQFGIFYHFLTISQVSCVIFSKLLRLNFLLHMWVPDSHGGRSVPAKDPAVVQLSLKAQPVQSCLAPGDFLAYLHTLGLGGRHRLLSSTHSWEFQLWFGSLTHLQPQYIRNKLEVLAKLSCLHKKCRDRFISLQQIT